MIQAVELSFGFSDHILFENVTFSLQKGEKLGLIGRNGSGKTTLFKLLAGIETPLKGNLIIPKNYKVGYLDQHIKFTHKVVLDEARTALDRQDGSEDYLAKKVLLGLGFSNEDLLEPISSFSGGYQLRLHLAKILIQKPDLLLLDEPTNYLDIVSINWLKNYLKNYPSEIICITHDRNFMDAISTHTMGLHRKRIKKIQGKTQDYFEKILQDEENFEKTRLNLEKKAEHLETFINRFGAKATKAKQAQSKKKMLDKIPVLEKLNAIDNLNFSFNDAPLNGMKLVELFDASFSYDGKNPIIENFNFEILKGEKIAIIGKNGFGKTTLLKLIGSMLQPTHGAIKTSTFLQIGYFGQTHIQTLHPDWSILEEIRQANSKLNEQEAKAICGAMMFSSHVMEKKISVLSGGEKSRVLLGTIIAKPCNLILLDEPTHHLDMESIESLIEAVDATDSACVIVTHDEEILKRLPLDKIVFCSKNEQKIHLGDYEEFSKKYPHLLTEPHTVDLHLSLKNSTSDYQEMKELQSQMRKIEKKIIQNEEELKRVEEVILNEMQQAKNPKPELFKKQKLLKDEIEELFEQLEILDSQYRKFKSY